MSRTRGLHGYYTPQVDIYLADCVLGVFKVNDDINLQGREVWQVCRGAVKWQQKVLDGLDAAHAAHDSRVGAQIVGTKKMASR